MCSKELSHTLLRLETPTMLSTNLSHNLARGHAIKQSRQSHREFPGFIRNAGTDADEDSSDDQQ
jgi:hypothetical protein